VSKRTLASRFPTRSPMWSYMIFSIESAPDAARLEKS
jgi:hypothetical protein